MQKLTKPKPDMISLKVCSACLNETTNVLTDSCTLASWYLYLATLYQEWGTEH